MGNGYRGQGAGFSLKEMETVNWVDSQRHKRNQTSHEPPDQYLCGPVAL